MVQPGSGFDPSIFERVDEGHIRNVATEVERFGDSLRIVQTHMDAFGKLYETFDTRTQRQGFFEREREHLDEYGRKFRDVITQTDRGLLGMQQIVQERATTMGKTFEVVFKKEFLSSFEDGLNRTQAKLAAFTREATRQMTEARGSLNIVGSGTGLSGSRGAFAAGSGFASSLLSNMPMGGLLGVMLYGNKRESEFDAATRKIAMVFNQVGQSDSVFRRVRGTIEGMHRELGGMGEQLATNLMLMRNAGMSAEESFANVKGAPNTRFGKGLAGSLTAYEAGNGFDPGTVTRMVTQLRTGGAGGGAQSNEAILGDLMRVDTLAQKTKQSVQGLMEAFTQGAASLRVQRQGVGDLADSYEKLSASLIASGRYGTGANVNRQAAGQAAMSGISAAAGGLGGLSEGLMGELARRMGEPAGVQSIVRMQLGMLGNGDQAGKVFKELGKLAGENSGGFTGEAGELQRTFFLEKIAPSLGLEGANAVARMSMGTGNLEDVKKGLVPPMTKMAQGFDLLSNTISPWTKQVEKLLLDLAKIGSGLLSIVASGLNILVLYAAKYAGGVDIPDKVLTGAGLAFARGADAGFAHVQAGLKAIPGDFVSPLTGQFNAGDIIAKYAKDKEPTPQEKIVEQAKTARELAVHRLKLTGEELSTMQKFNLQKELQAGFIDAISGLPGGAAAVQAHPDLLTPATRVGIAERAIERAGINAKVTRMQVPNRGVVLEVRVLDENGGSRHERRH